MSEDETVNGPKVAALILSHMKGSNKEKIVRAIQERHPELATKIEESLFNFEELADLTPQGMQMLIKDTDPQDLLLAMKTASPKVKIIVTQNMSDRRRAVFNEELTALPPSRLSDVEAAQRRILTRLDQLRTSGAIRTQSKNDIWV